MGEFNVNKSDGSLDPTAGMPETYPATQVILESGDSVEDAIGNLLNGAVFEPFSDPGTSPFAEGSSGYVLKVKYNNTILGYFIIRPKGFSGTGNRKVALELYDANWSQAWEVHRDYPN